jgi:hypothetical protein
MLPLPPLLHVMLCAVWGLQLRLSWCEPWPWCRRREWRLWSGLRRSRHRDRSDCS